MERMSNRAPASTAFRVRSMASAVRTGNVLFSTTMVSRCGCSRMVRVSSPRTGGRRPCPAAERLRVRVHLDEHLRQTFTTKLVHDADGLPPLRWSPARRNRRPERKLPPNLRPGLP
jgi:hypothetical protein